MELSFFSEDITERKQAEAKIIRQNMVLQGISRIFEKAIGSDTEEDLGRTCLEVIESITGSKISFIGEIGPDGYFHDLAISNPGWELCDMYDKSGHRRLPGDFVIHGLYGRVLQDGKSLITNNPSTYPDRIGVPAGHPALTAFLGVPLIYGGKTIGMIAVANRDGGYRTEDQEDLESLAPVVMEAFLRKRAEEALHKHREHLEELVKERTIKLEVMNTQLKEEVNERKRAEVELRNSEERFRTSVGNMLDGFAIFSTIRDDTGHITDFRYMYVNDALCQINKETREEQIGHTLLELRPDYKEMGLFHEYVKLVETGQPVIKESWTREHVDGGGKKLRQIVGFRAVKLGDGIAVAVRDVTERKIAEEERIKSEEQYHRLVENAPGIVYSFSNKRGGIYYSSRVEEILGYSPQYLYQNSFLWNTLIHPDDQSKLPRLLKI